MRRFLSTTMGLLLAPLVLVLISSSPRVAAQNIQPSQKSGGATDLTAVHVPEGMTIEIECPYTLSSIDFKTNDKISFRVVDPIQVNGTKVVERGATATGRVDIAKRGGHFGKAGTFAWTMQSVTAVDGSQIPLRPGSERLRGDSKGAQVATGMIIGGVLLGPAAPLVLLHGFKRGKDALIPAGKRYSVVVGASSLVNTHASTKSEM